MKNVRQQQKIHSAASVLGTAFAVALAAVCSTARADAPAELPFVNAATAYSQAAKIDRAIDPQVFVHDSAATQGTGPERIEHLAGLRTARLDDDPETATYAADGSSLSLSLGHWLEARGTLSVTTEPDGHVRVATVFKHLVAFGEYSLFLATDHLTDGTGVTTYRPLDGEGTANSFVAHVDGSAAILIDTSAALTDADSVVLVYHSDGREHGTSRGQIGLTAHEQLAVRLTP
ncbi:MAG TPA: hypothetical protein VGD50_04490 [Candidatus Baltobacteraceae bacterium]